MSFHKKLYCSMTIGEMNNPESFLCYKWLNFSECATGFAYFYVHGTVHLSIYRSYKYQLNAAFIYDQALLNLSISLPI